MFGSFRAAGSTTVAARSIFCAGTRLTPASDLFLRVRTTGEGADLFRLAFGAARSFCLAALSTAVGTTVFVHARVEGAGGLSAIPLFCLCTRFTPASDRVFLAGEEMAWAARARETFGTAASAVSVPLEGEAGLRLEPGATDFTLRARVTGSAASPPLSLSCCPFVASSAAAADVRPAEITSRTNEFRSDVTKEAAAAPADSYARDVPPIVNAEEGLGVSGRLPVALEDFLLFRPDPLATLISVRGYQYGASCQFLIPEGRRGCRKIDPVGQLCAQFRTFSCGCAILKAATCYHGTGTFENGCFRPRVRRACRRVAWLALIREGQRSAGGCWAWPGGRFVRCAIAIFARLPT